MYPIDLDVARTADQTNGVEFRSSNWVVTSKFATIVAAVDCIDQCMHFLCLAPP